MAHDPTVTDEAGSPCLDGVEQFILRAADLRAKERSDLETQFTARFVRVGKAFGETPVFLEAERRTGKDWPSKNSRKGTSLTQLFGVYQNEQTRRRIPRNIGRVALPHQPPPTRDCTDCGAAGMMTLQNAIYCRADGLLLYICERCQNHLTIPPPPLSPGPRAPAATRGRMVLRVRKRGEW